MIALSILYVDVSGVLVLADDIARLPLNFFKGGLILSFPSARAKPCGFWH